LSVIDAIQRPPSAGRTTPNVDFIFQMWP